MSNLTNVQSKFQRCHFLPVLQTKMNRLVIPALGQVWGEKSSHFCNLFRAPSGH